MKPAEHRWNGFRLVWEERGSGPPLVLIHGLGGPPTVARLFDLLAVKHRTFAVALPGFQPGGHVGALPTLDQTAQLLHSFIAAMIGVPVAVAGSSYGGQVGATLAAMDSGVVYRLMLVSSTGLWRKEILAWPPVRATVRLVVRGLLPRSPWLVCRLGKKAFFDPAAQPREACGEFREMLRKPGNAAAWYRALECAVLPESSWAERLASITVPTAIFWGREDRIIPSTQALALQQRIRNSSVRYFEKCGHALPIEKAGDLAGAMAAFLAS